MCWRASQYGAGLNETCCDRIGGARVLLAGVALWSLGTLMAPPCAHAGLLALCASRVIVRPAPAPPLSDMRRAGIDPLP